MEIKELMTKDLITIDKDQNLTDAIKLMQKNKISRLPVLNTNQEHKKELVGIISERDIADKIGSAKFEKKPISQIHVSSIMVKDVIKVLEDDDLKDVAKLMLDNGIGSVPIMDEENNLVGIASKADFLTFAKERNFDKMPVKDVMSTNITFVSPDERLVHARRLMLDAKVGRLPVIEDDKLVGIITSKDLIRAFIDIKKNVQDNHQKTKLKETLVDEIMSKNPLSANDNESVSKVVNLMLETGFNGIPIISDHDNVMGIITQTDILKIIAILEN